jgi:hypothetical protein
MPGNLPENCSPASQNLFALAVELAASCPSRLGKEILVTGSVSWGIADQYSDLDLEFWVEAIPEYSQCLDWLLNAGVSQAKVSELSEVGMHIIGAYRETWVEFGWRKIQHIDTIVQEISSSETTARSRLVHGWNICHAVSLRGTGRLEEWQARLSVYPEKLRGDIIIDSAAFWSFPHHLDMLWTLAERRELMGLDEWMFADLQDALRILYALNRQWEPDWKNITAASACLEQKPPRLDERIRQIFTEMPPERRIRTLLELILEILGLVPDGIDIRYAVENIENNLQKHRRG